MAGNGSAIVIGNWKMCRSRAQLGELAAMDAAAARHGAELVLCVPFPLIDAARPSSGRLAVGAQDCHHELEGPHTGSTSPAMLREAGATHVIVGHSERRAAFGETDALVRRKAAAAIVSGLAAVVCVGESAAERRAGNAAEVVAGQVARAVPPDVAPDRLLVAYEPVWAIGSGRTPEAAEIAEVHLAMRATLRQVFGQRSAAVRLLYGGSVTAANAEAILAVPEVDGVLVGSASLTARDLNPVIALAGERARAVLAEIAARARPRASPPPSEDRPAMQPMLQATDEFAPEPRAVFRFGGGASDGGRGDRDLLGGKGANLAEMASLGLPVPPGFTIATPVCARFHEAGGRLPDGLAAEVADGLAHIEAVTGRRFGDAADPLLVSVRSGARVSMPGMMDTVLNLGLNDATVEGLAAASGDARFAWDSYRRFVQMYADVVLGLDHGRFEEALEVAKEDNGFSLDTELSAGDLRRLVATYKGLVEEEWGRPFPQDVHDQLWGAVGAVFGSWRSERAKVYRRLNDIPAGWGTAVNVQAMVFGNMGDTSATGVAFTRDPSTGERVRYGEFLLNAQGEDVVAGIRTPQYLTKAAREAAGARALSMEEALPDTYSELAQVFDLLERHYRDMQDIEFTVERGTLWMLQTRSGKRTAAAALRLAVEMAGEGLISREEAVARVDPASLDQLLHPTLDPAAPRDVIARGLPASPGAASGKVVFDAATAERQAAAGDAVILVRAETSPEDIGGMHAARGILTARGGMTSHAAVVARGMGRPCVSGVGSLAIDMAARLFRCAGRVVREGDMVTIDGATGEVIVGAVATRQPELAGDFGTLMDWADGVRRLKVRANAETTVDARVARRFGAEGIGLCRTEHMFFSGDRITAVRQMILAADEAGRRAALAKLLPEQRADFAELFGIMAGLPVTVRLLDPPLHEFLPAGQADFAELAAATGLPIDQLEARAAELHEFNPMLGHRGCRLGVTFPEIYEMQARAIFEAACEVAAAAGERPVPEIMVPLVATARELELMKAVIDRTAAAVFAERGQSLPYLVGTMIELPRAALRAGEIAGGQGGAEFFSFGTNDLTQTALGISRDDAGRFLDTYVEQGVYPSDPFVSLDVDGVGELVRLAAERGRATRPGLKLGICGEHGGDPASIRFCEAVGLDYVSASPYRIPIARLAAAQAALHG